MLDITINLNPWQPLDPFIQFVLEGGRLDPPDRYRQRDASRRGEPE